jgi:hypothetical protein
MVMTLRHVPPAARERSSRKTRAGIAAWIVGFEPTRLDEIDTSATKVSHVAVEGAVRAADGRSKARTPGAVGVELRSRQPASSTASVTTRARDAERALGGTTVFPGRKRSNRRRGVGGRRELQRLDRPAAAAVLHRQPSTRTTARRASNTLHRWGNGSGVEVHRVSPRALERARVFYTSILLICDL